jgi:hypothetical protein
VKATNYGEKQSGGDTYSMGYQLNEELSYAWREFKQDRAWLKMHPDRFSAVLLASDSRNNLKRLLRIRKAGRKGIG